MFSLFDEERRRRVAQGQQAQQATNGSGAMRLVQGFTQPASGHMPSRDSGAPPVRQPAPRPFGTYNGVGQPRVQVANVGSFQYAQQAGGGSPRPSQESQSFNPPVQVPPPMYGRPQQGADPERRPLIADPGIGGNNMPPEETPPPPFNEGGTPGVNGNPNPAPVVPPPAPGTTPPPTPPPDNSSNWDTNGYAKPAYIAPNPGPVPAGWDPQKWADPNHQSPKYVVGRILSQYPPTVAGLDQAMAEIARAYPGAKRVGPGDIEVLGGVVDVLQGAAQGGRAWGWIDASGAAAAPPPSGGGGTPPPAGGGGGDEGSYGGPPAGDEPKHEKAVNPMLNNPGMDEAFKALLQALGMAVPDAAGLKEASKEQLLATRQADSEALASQAAAAGLGRSGIPLALEAGLRDDFNANYTKSSRDIDLASQQQGFQNLMNVAGGFQSHGAEQFGQEFSLKQLEQNAAQFAQQMGFNYAQLAQNDKQFFLSYALNKWIAEKNQQNRELELLTGGLG